MCDPYSKSIGMRSPWRVKFEEVQALVVRLEVSVPNECCKDKLTTILRLMNEIACAW